MHIDHFFNYGRTDLETEIRGDVEICLLTPYRKMFYMRSYGSEISEYENKPITEIARALLKYNITKALATQNTNTTTGADGTRDRRILTSQSNINVTTNGQELNIQVGYLPMYNTTSKGQLDLSLGGI
ncbi:MAG: hypothetical protein HDQ88_03895 [Clostridia bacterium]|nr:hypothetical protein [Clostridia bacterium]